MIPSWLELSPNLTLSILTGAAMVALVAFEWLGGRNADGRKTAEDWKMFGLSMGGITLLERPLMFAAVYYAAGQLASGGIGWLSRFESEHLALSVVLFVALDELLHGGAHYLTHRRPPRARWLARIQAFYREAHRAHHQLGGADGRGQVSVTQAIVAGWGWMLFLPNYWLGAALLALGLEDTWLIGMLFKNLWGMHVHTNWTYDLYLLNHPNRWVRRAMYALCHVLTFPNQHHQHHARGRASTRNMQNVLAVYDWLLWGTLLIERERPRVYGWHQRPEERGALHRYLARPLRLPPPR